MEQDEQLTRTKSDITLSKLYLLKKNCGLGTFQENDDTFNNAQ